MAIGALDRQSEPGTTAPPPGCGAVRRTHQEGESFEMRLTEARRPSTRLAQPTGSSGYAEPPTFEAASAVGAASILAAAPPRGEADPASRAALDRASGWGGIEPDGAAPDLPVEIASARGAGRNVLRALSAITPDVLVVGETHPSVPGIGAWGAGGQFLLMNVLDGTYTYFGSKPFRPLPPIGPISQGLSVVGTRNLRTGKMESGIGYTARIPTPAGDVAVFINARGGDGATLRDFFDGDRSGTVSVNFGAIYSISDAAAFAANIGLPGAGFAARALARASGLDAWIGAAYRGQATFSRGRLVSVRVSGVDVPVARLPQLFGATRPQLGQGAADLAVGGVLVNAYRAGGANLSSAAAWAQETYESGGVAGLSARAREVVGRNVPQAPGGGASVTVEGFRALGMGAQASEYAMEAYTSLRTRRRNPASVSEAWQSVWNVYLEGVPRRGSRAARAGLRDGGDAGGLAAVRTYALSLR